MSRPSRFRTGSQLRRRLSGSYGVPTREGKTSPFSFQSIPTAARSCA
ncbi:hypothetical protein [Streptomyces johnsoniae]|uniref:Uncharacterized protein n=1 Tax=Streptomyces johnsoniae TaxID=3075532 RepID=A0ABU2S8K6_9ACTN|nr:hypothetical protein [Streptomyces sp. DSM 41886]MDT0445143.1 hypothetical protein [Streptomyces sp. DSM 41886]